MNVLWWAVPLAVFVFSWTLNEFLRGKLKETVGGVLALLIFGFVGLAFLFSGWLWGLGALVGAFILSNIYRPVALAVARRMITYPDLGVERYQHERMQQTLHDFGSEDYFKRRAAEEKSEQVHRNRVVANALKDEHLREVLGRHGSSKQDLAALYDRVEVRTLPPKMREAVLRNPELVDYFLGNSTPAEFRGEYVRNVTGQATSMTLALWCSSNPGGKRPH
ncbi:MAG: hypothetical protein ACRD1R_11035 [Acidobacteriota bacterium]